MDVLSQLMCQVMNSVSVKIPDVSSGKSGDATGFDSMIRDKYQQSEGQKTQEQPETAKKDNTESTKSDNPTETKDNGETPKPEGQPAKVEDMKQQYETAAAMMLQLQPVVYVEPEAQSVEAPVVQQANVPVEAVVETQTAVPVIAEQQGVIQENSDIVTANLDTQDVNTAPQVQQDNTIKTVETPVQDSAPVEAAPETREQPQARHQETAPGFAESRPETIVQTTDTSKPQQEFVKVVEDMSEEPAVQEDEVPVEAPVFGELEATPVKVADAPQKPVEIEAEDAPQQIMDRIEVPLQEGESRVVLSLTPENLGHVTVEITRTNDGSLNVVLSASTSKAAALLEQHSTGLQNLLAVKNDADVQIEVRGGENAQQQFLDPNGRNGQQQSQQQQQQHQPEKEHQVQDFMQQLRLGLVNIDEAS